MLLYGIYILNGHTRFLGEVYIGNELEIKRIVLDKKEGPLKNMGDYASILKTKLGVIAVDDNKEMAKYNKGKT